MTREHHPVADLFPMLPDDELKDLAADIRERGLLQAIVLDSQGRILDGRNRYAACELASVEPEFETYDGDDPDGYALAVNIARRHLTKGQIAMVAAKAMVNKDYSQRDTAGLVGVNQSYVMQAGTVLDFASDLADSVVGGTMPLNDAYKTAQQRKKDVDTYESRLAKLRGQAPDLYDLVGSDSEDGMSLDEAEGALQARINNARSAARSLNRNLDELKDAALRLRTTQLDGRLQLAFDNGEKPIRPQDVTAIAPDLKKTVSTLNEIAEHLEGITDA